MRLVERTEVHAWHGGGSSYDDPPGPTPVPDHLHTSGRARSRASKDPRELAHVGVVVGRFRPLHEGHVHLVREAFARCGFLHLVVPHLVGDGSLAPDAMNEERRLHQMSLSIALQDDVAATHRVQAPRNDSPEAWSTILAALDPKPTRLFSSDRDAARLANSLGIEHVLIDPDRLAFPVSSTMIRNDFARMFHWLAPAARTTYATLVGLAGAGKTTLAQAIATELGAPVIADSLRVAAEANGGRPPRQAFESIALSHTARADAWRAAMDAAATGIVLDDDTRMNALLWLERLGEPQVRHPRPSNVPLYRDGTPTPDPRVDLWLLCPDDDAAFHGPADDLAARATLFARTQEALRNANVVEIHGTPDERIARAVAAVREARAVRLARSVAALS